MAQCCAIMHIFFNVLLLLGQTNILQKYSLERSDKSGLRISNFGSKIVKNFPAVKKSIFMTHDFYYKLIKTNYCICGTIRRGKRFSASRTKIFLFVIKHRNGLKGNNFRKRLEQHTHCKKGIVKFLYLM